MNHTIIHDRAGLNQFYAKVYAFVGLGIGLSALVSGLMLTVFQSQLVYFLMQGRLWLTIATFAELALVFVASSMASKNSPAALPVFLLYSVLNGFTLSFVVAFYTPGTVLSAFVSSTLLFFVMAAVGIFTKKDLSGIGRGHGGSWYLHQERLEWDWSSDDGGSYWFTDCYGSQYFLG